MTSLASHPPLPLHLLVLLLLRVASSFPASASAAAAATASATAAPRGEAECPSGLKCENGGICQKMADGAYSCRCPPPPSPLLPSFFVGVRCHIPATMCADTSTFYCAWGSTCVEVVQGENYTCQGCNSAIAGPHCDAEGVPCATPGLVCFNGGTCPSSSSSSSCACPPQWSGNANCTAPSIGSGGSRDAPAGGEEEETWYVPLLGALGALIMLSFLGGLIYFCYSQQPHPSSHKDAEESLRLQEGGGEGEGEGEGVEDVELPGLNLRGMQREQSSEDPFSAN